MESISGVVRAPPSGISVLVVGAGPAGVFAALECWRKGHDVRIIERNASARTQGDFFAIAPQVISHIEKRWPEMAVENDAIAELPWITYRTIQGQLLSGPAPFDFGISVAKGAELPKVHRHNRPKFLAMLLTQLKKLGVEVEYGHRVVDYQEDAHKAWVVTDDGQTLEADVVVAADGIGSKSHRLINGSDVRAFSSGMACFRTAFPTERLAADPELDERFKILDNGHTNFEMWAGPKTVLALYRTKDISSWLLQHEDLGIAQESWQQSVGLEVVLDYLDKTVPGFPEDARKFIKATPEGGIIDWELKWRDPQEKTTSPLGRVIQAGDAAHTFLPSGGGGANHGIEDAISLATCIALAGKDDIELGAKVHNKLRFERVQCGQKLGLLNQQRRNNPNLAAVLKNPTMIKSEFGRWIFEHKPEQYTNDNFQQAAEHVRHGAPFQNTNIPPGHTYQPWTVNQLLQQVKEGTPIHLDGDLS